MLEHGDVCLFVQGKYMDIEFDFKGDPVGGVITNCESEHNWRVFTWCVTAVFG